MLLLAMLTVSGAVVLAPPAGAAASSDLIISEFRLRGPAGPADEFVEIYNPANTSVTVQAFDSSAGWALVASDGTARFTILNGTVIPARGHFLGVNSTSYSLAGYPAGSGTATGDTTYTTDIPDNAGIALFRSADPAAFVLANRSDAVGSSSESNSLYREGVGYPPLATGPPLNIDYSFFRSELSGEPVDTDVNVDDFVFADPNGTGTAAGQLLGAPGPQNLSSPVTSNTGLPVTLLDPTVTDKVTPNFVRDQTSDPANNSTFGTVSLRRTVTNNTGVPITRLRFRIVKESTFPAPLIAADLRARTSPDVSVTVGVIPHTVHGTTLEEPPGQANGGGYNASLSASTVTLGTPLADGAAIDVQLLFGVQQTGAMEADLSVEATPGAPTGGSPTLFACPSTEPSGPGPCVNTAPVASTDDYTTPEDTTLSVPAPGLLANDTDVDGDPLTAVADTDPANGTLTLNADGSFDYVPDADFNGTDTFTYQASDGHTTSGAATVTIHTTAVNDPPAVVDDGYTTAEDTTVTITAPGVLTNDSDVDGDPLTVVIGTGPAHGSLTLNPNGSFGYTPDADYNGSDTFTYRATDGHTTSALATVTLTITPVNDAPVTGDDVYSTAAGTALTIAAPGVLTNDSDADGDALTVTVATGPGHGTLTLNPDGSFRYTPDAGYTGPDVFTYQASDGTTSSTATVLLIVTPVNAPPTVAGGSYTTAENTSLTVGPPGVLTGANDADGDSLTAVLGLMPAHGTVTLKADGSFVYTPDANYSGTDTFTFMASDGLDSSAPATITLTVTAVSRGSITPVLPNTGANPMVPLRWGILLVLLGAAAIVGAGRPPARPAGTTAE